MRILLSVVVSLGLAFGMYLIFLHSAGKAVGGSPAAATATVTVQVQLTNLAQAERMYFVQNNSYASLEQLSASGDFKLPNPDSNDYLYTVQVSEGGFNATAQHAPGPAQSAANFPVFTIDQTMSVHRGEAQAGGPSQGNGGSADGAKPGDAAPSGNAAKAADSDNAGKADDIPSFPTSIPSLPAGLAPAAASGAAAQPQN